MWLREPAFLDAIQFTASFPSLGLQSKAKPNSEQETEDIKNNSSSIPWGNQLRDTHSDKIGSVLFHPTIQKVLNLDEEACIAYSKDSVIQWINLIGWYFLLDYHLVLIKNHLVADHKKKNHLVILEKYHTTLQRMIFIP